jgi:hypothetical protein
MPPDEGIEKVCSRGKMVLRLVRAGGVFETDLTG